MSGNEPTEAELAQMTDEEYTRRARTGDGTSRSTARRRTSRRSQRSTAAPDLTFTPEQVQVEEQALGIPAGASNLSTEQVMQGSENVSNPESTVPPSTQEALASEQPYRVPVVDQGRSLAIDDRPVGIVANVRLSDETDDIFILNDLVFTIPPLAIQVIKHSFTQTEQTLRTSNAMKSKSGQSECEVIFTVAFVGKHQFRKNLRRLIANFKYAPIAFIENSFVRNQVNPDFIFGPGTSMAVILESLSVTTVEQQPETLIAECRCKLFNYKPFTGNFFFKKDWRTNQSLGLQESIMGDLDALTSRFGSQAVAPNVASDDIQSQASAFGADEHHEGLQATSPVRFPGNSQPFTMLMKTALDERMEYVPDSWTNKIKFDFREYRRVSLPAELVQIQSQPTPIRPAALPPARPAPVTPAASLEPQSRASGSISVPRGTYILPTGTRRAVINSPFGARALAVRASNWHRGIDIYLPIGSPMYAIADGVVSRVMPGGGPGNGGFGKIIVVHHPQLGVYTAYGHCSGFPENIRNGSPVRAGDVVAFSGNTTGGGRRPVLTNGSPHLHFEVRRRFNTSAETQPMSSCMDPEVFLASLGLAYGLKRETLHYHRSRGRAIYPPRSRGDGRPLRPIEPGVSSPDYDQTWPIRASNGQSRYAYSNSPIRPRIPMPRDIPPPANQGVLPFPSSAEETRISRLNPPRRRSRPEESGDLDQGSPDNIPESDIVFTQEEADVITRTQQTPQGPVQTPVSQAQPEASQAFRALGTRFEISPRAQQIFDAYIAQNAVNGWRHYSEQMPQIMDVFYRDYEDADGVGLNIFHEDEELVPVGANVVYQNRFATIPLLSHQYPTYQFIGGNDCVFAIRFNGIGQEKLQRLQLMFDLMESNARNFRFVKNSAIVNISENEFLNLFSVKQLVTENIEVKTHASNPTLYDVVLTFSEFKPTKETIVRENITTQGIVEQILRRIFSGADSFTGNDFLRQTYDEASLRQETSTTEDRSSTVPLRGGETAYGFSRTRPEIAQRAQQVAWLRTELQRVVEEIRTTNRRIVSRRISEAAGVPYGDLFGAERLLNGTLQDRALIDQEPDQMGRLFTRDLADTVAFITEGIGNLTGTGDTTAPIAGQIRGAVGAGQRPPATVIREHNTSHLTGLRNRLLAIGEAIYNHGAEDAFDDFFPEIASSMVNADRVLSGVAYPDLILPNHPVTNRAEDVNPDFYFWSDGSDGGISRLLESDMLAAQGFLNNSYQSFASITGVEGGTDWFNSQYLSRTRRSIEQQAQTGFGNRGRNPLHTLEGWDGADPATNTYEVSNGQLGDGFFHRLLKTSGGAHVPLMADIEGNRTLYEELVSATYGDGNPRFGPRTGRTPQGEHNFTLAHVQSLLREAILTFRQTALKMARAFPTFKLYFLQENSQSPSRFVSFDDFYSYSSVKEIRVTRHRKIPADLCVIRLTNLSGILSNASYYNRANNPNMIFANGNGEDNGGIPSGNLTVYNPFRHHLGTASNFGDVGQENVFDALLLKEGCKIQVRLGYENDPDKLPIVFTGQIVEIQNAGRPDELVLVAQNYGVELVLEQKGKDPEMQGEFANTMELLSAMICSPELTHFGRWGLNTDYSPYEIRHARDPRATTLTSVMDYITDFFLSSEDINKYLMRWQFLNDPQDDNLFPPPTSTYLPDGIVESLIDSFLENKQEAAKYVPQGNTVWDIFKEMELRHPGWIAAPEYYGDRMTMFFGIPSQRYWARPFSQTEAMAQRRITRESDAAEQRRDALRANREQRLAALRPLFEERARVQEELDEFNRDAEARGPTGARGMVSPDGVPIEEHIQRQRAIYAAQLRDLDARIVAGQTTAAADEELVVQNQAFGSVLQDAGAALAAGRLKAFRNYHLLTSFNHIISNEIKTSSKNLPNAIQVGYYDSNPGSNVITPTEAFGITDNEATFDSFKVMSIKADDNISDHMTQYAYYTSPNCKTRFFAKRYAVALVARGLRDAYKGRLIITGEPKIKPWDVCYVFDSYTDMFGPIEVKGVTHIFDEDGFRSEIMPDLVVNINEWSCCGVMDALQLVAMRLGVNISSVSMTGRDADALVWNNSGYGVAGAAGLGAAAAGATQLAGRAVPLLPAAGGAAVLASHVLIPAGIIATGSAYLAAYGGLKFIQWTQERQPVIVTPLLFGGKPFVAGIDGFKQDGLVSNAVGRFRRWSEDFGIGLQGLLAGGRIEQLQAEIMRSLAGSTVGAVALANTSLGDVIAP